MQCIQSIITFLLSTESDTCQAQLCQFMTNPIFNYLYIQLYSPYKSWQEILKKAVHQNNNSNYIYKPGYAEYKYGKVRPWSGSIFLLVLSKSLPCCSSHPPFLPSRSLFFPLTFLSVTISLGLLSLSRSGSLWCKAPAIGVGAQSTLGGRTFLPEKYV